MSLSRRAFVSSGIPAVGLPCFAQNAGRGYSGEDERLLAQYYPTPKIVVRRMLEMTGLQSGETMFDIGSGDGRIVLMAAKNFGARAIGVELKRDLVEVSRQAIARTGAGGKVRIIHGDALEQDYSSADAITVYLLPEFLDRLQPILTKQLKPGTRIVSHDYGFRGWKPIKTVEMDDDEGRKHTLFLYKR